jgi:hypothetical protein
MFRHTGLTDRLKDMDKAIAEVENPKLDAKGLAKAIAEGRSAHKSLVSAVSTYSKKLESEINEELAESKGDKNKHYRALKYMKSELEALCKKAEYAVDAVETFRNQQISTAEKLAKVVKQQLLKVCAEAAVAIKHVKAAPTPATYNEHFAVSDTPGRKIGVALKSASDSVKKGLLPDGIMDPGHLFSHFTDYGTQGAPRSKIAETASAAEVLAFLADFAKAVKLAAEYAARLP